MIQPIYGIKINYWQTCTPRGDYLMSWVTPGITYNTDLLGDGAFTTLDINEAYECRAEISLRSFSAGFASDADVYTVEEHL